jgi:glycosyltransferase involved in cell wall biosynthesis
VIYPPVEVNRYAESSQRGNYFVTLSRLVPHKRLDLIVEAFRELQLPLKIIGDGPEREKLQKRRADNIEFLGFQSEEAVACILGSARGFVCASEEDFGIAMVEAQAAGCPVIAYRAGGALETVIEGVTGVLFDGQSSGSLIEAVQRFQATAQGFRSAEIREHARRFDKGCFSIALQEFVSSRVQEV